MNEIITLPVETVNTGPYEGFASRYAANFDIDGNWPFLPEFFALVRVFLEDREYSWKEMHEPEVMGWFTAWVDLQGSLEFVRFPLVRDGDETDKESVRYDLHGDDVVVCRVSRTETESFVFLDGDRKSE